MEGGTEHVLSVLKGECSLDLGKALELAMAPASYGGSPRMALSFDTNALHNLSLISSAPQVVDYLRSDHRGPLIIPSQAVVEFWNHRVVDLSGRGKTVRTAFNNLLKEADKFAEEYQVQGAKVRELAQAVLSEIQVEVDPALRETVERNLLLIAERATFPFVSRTELHAIAESRKATSTPPGFRDQGHGDLMVWVETLVGVEQSGVDDVDALVVVTDDVKDDWSFGGRPHPYLIAEARRALGVELHLWTSRQLSDYVTAGR